MRAYSLDLRQKVVAAVGRVDSTIKEVAATFGVGQTFIKKMLRQHRETGDLSPRPHGGGQAPRLSDRHLKLLQQEVSRSPDKTAAALRDHLEERAGVSVSRPTVTRALTRLGLSRKKKCMAASERNNYKRGWFWRRVWGMNHRRFIFLDSVGR